MLNNRNYEKGSLVLTIYDGRAVVMVALEDSGTKFHRFKILSITTSSDENHFVKAVDGPGIGGHISGLIIGRLTSAQLDELDVGIKTPRLVIEPTDDKLAELHQGAGSPGRHVTT